MSASALQKTAPVSFTRPSNTTSYAAGQVINGNGSTSPLQFEINVPPNANIWIVGGQCSTSVSTNVPNINLMLFSGLVTVAADGSAFAPTDDEMKNFYLGTISFAAFTALGSNGFCDGSTASGKPIIGTPNGTTIYAVAVANGSYSPASSEIFSFRFDYQPASN